jgi:hypothetical protein
VALDLDVAVAAARPRGRVQTGVGKCQDKFKPDSTIGGFGLYTTDPPHTYSAKQTQSDLTD